MFGPSITLFRAFGFAIRIDLSWLVIAALVTWSLAAFSFPAMLPGLTPGTYWLMGAAGALGLFTSIVLHELGHALMARRYGLEMRGITLFIFGGVAEMQDEPPSAAAELMIAIAGPLVSIALAVIFYGLSLVPAPAGAEPAMATVRWLGFINGLLVLFNMIPAFPLDGGRVLRAAIWSSTNSLRRATRIASRVGAGFGIALMIFGGVNLLLGNLIGAFWWVILGMFLRDAARMSYRQVIVREALEGEPVSRFMRRDPVVVPANITLDHLVSDYMYRHHHKMFPVVESGRLVGCISTRELKTVPREEWGARAVSDVASACTADNTTSPDDDALDALAKMSRAGLSRLIVVDEDRVAGVIALKDLLSFLSMKMELEGDAPGATPRAPADHAPPPRGRLAGRIPAHHHTDQ